MNFILYGISGSFVYLYYLCCWHKLANKPIELKSWKIYFSLIVFDILGTMTNFFLPPFFKMISITSLLVILSYWIVFRKIKESLIATLIVQIIMMLCESLFVLALTTIFSVDINSFMNKWYGIVVMNFVVAMICLITIKLRFINKSFSFFMELATKMQKNRLIKYSVIMILIAVSFTTTMYMDLSFEQLLLFNTLIILFYVWLAVRVSTSEVKHDETEHHYNTKKETLENYEQEMENYMIAHHELKNGLKTLRDMLKKNDKNVENYLNALLNDMQVDSVKAEIAYKIPICGLKSIVHDKFCEMDMLGIPYQLYISRGIKASKFLDFTDKDILDICKIMGVYLDNAIHEISKIDSEDRLILVELYLEKKYTCISVTNPYITTPRLNDMSRIKYTTKGKGHGYGLLLVKDVVEKNGILKVETEICKGNFTQTLKIKM